MQTEFEKWVSIALRIICFYRRLSLDSIYLMKAIGYVAFLHHKCLAYAEPLISGLRISLHSIIFWPCSKFPSDPVLII